MSTPTATQVDADCAVGGACIGAEDPTRTHPVPPSPRRAAPAT